MSNSVNEAARKEILVQCYGYRPVARDAERICRQARMEGEVMDATPALFAREAEYLAGDGLIEKVPDELSPAHVRWRITSAGVRYVESNDLV